MDVNVQDPPRSYGDLEGAWCVWKQGGSASPMVGDEGEDQILETREIKIHESSPLIYSVQGAGN